MAESDPDSLGIKRLIDGHWRSMPRSDEYFAVTYVEPPIENKPAIGFDLASDPVRLATLDLARDSGRLVFSKQIVLINKDNGILALLPVYGMANRKAIRRNGARRCAD